MSGIIVCEHCAERLPIGVDKRCAVLSRHAPKCRAKARAVASKRTARLALADLSNRDACTFGQATQHEGDEMHSGEAWECRARPLETQACGNSPEPAPIAEARTSTPGWTQGEDEHGSAPVANPYVESPDTDDEGDSVSSDAPAGPEPEDSKPGEGNAPFHTDVPPIDPDKVSIEDVLGYDETVAWMIHGLTKMQMKKLFLGMQILPVLRGCGPEQNPFYHSKIASVEAYERYADAQVKDMLCGLEHREVKVQSDVPAVRDMPPVPLLIRPLSHALTCAFAANTIRSRGFPLQPISKINDPKLRVNSYMEGTHIHHAKQVQNNQHCHMHAQLQTAKASSALSARAHEHPLISVSQAPHVQARTSARLASGMSGADAIRPIVAICLFFDKTLINPMAKRCAAAYEQSV